MKRIICSILIGMSLLSAQEVVINMDKMVMTIDGAMYTLQNVSEASKHDFMILSSFLLSYSQEAMKVMYYIIMHEEDFPADVVKACNILMKTMLIFDEGINGEKQL